MKINQEKHFKIQLTTGTDESMGPTCQRHTEQGRGLTSGKLIDGEGNDDVFLTLLCTYWYPRFARRITGASSPASMVARRWCAVVLRPSSATAWPGERGYGIYEP